MSTKNVILACVFSLAPLLACNTATADEPVPIQQQTAISGNALSGIHGATMLNMAAGIGNQQANSASISLATPGKSRSMTAKTPKNIRLSVGNADQESSILGNAFSGATGIIDVNQAAGNGNLESNQTSIFAGAATPVTSQILARNTGSMPEMADRSPHSPSGTHEARISATAFRGADGVAQVNQISGSGNMSANRFSLGIAPGVLQ